MGGEVITSVWYFAYGRNVNVSRLCERRIAGSKEEKRESVRGEAEVKLKPPRRRREAETTPRASPLERFMA